MDSAVAGINGALSHLRAEPRGACSRSFARPATSASPSAGSSPPTSPIATDRSACRSRGRSSSMTRTTADSTASASRRSTTRWRASRATKLQCHSGADGVISESREGGLELQRRLPDARPHPGRSKDLVLTHADDHGSPPLSSGPRGLRRRGPGVRRPDAYDWNFCWKVWDGLRSCAIRHQCGYALGDTRRHRSNGSWSDGTPITR